MRNIKAYQHDTEVNGVLYTLTMLETGGSYEVYYNMADYPLEYMFGLSASDVSADEAMDIAAANLPEYIRTNDDQSQSTAIVKNQYGVSIDFDAAVNLMDDGLREVLHAQGIYTEQAFFEAYAKAHEAKYGEEWEMDKPNPQY